MSDKTIHNKLNYNYIIFLIRRMVKHVRKSQRRHLLKKRREYMFMLPFLFKYMMHLNISFYYIILL